MSEQQKITGKLIVIGEVQTFASGFSKREFVIETQGKYPQPIKLEAVKEKAEMIEAFDIGDLVEVSFDIRGNEHGGRYYVSLVAWKIEGIEKASPKSEPRTKSDPKPQVQDMTSPGDEDELGNIPF